MQKLKSLARRIRRLSFLGVSVEIRDKSQLKLVGALKELIKTKPLIIIIDEAPYLLETKKAQKFFAALHDVYVPKLLIVFTGSIITLKHIYEKNETRPLYGRIEEEITLEPFDEYNSRRYLETGFKQCGIEPPQELIEAAILRLGGFPGWLTLLGRIATRQKLVLGKINTQETIKELEERASKVVIGEMAKIPKTKKKLQDIHQNLKENLNRSRINTNRNIKSNITRPINHNILPRPTHTPRNSKENRKNIPNSRPNPKKNHTKTKLRKRSQNQTIKNYRNKTPTLHRLYAYMYI